MREWYVMRLGRAEDTNKARIYTGIGVGDGDLAEFPNDAPRQARRPAIQQGGLDVQQPRIGVMPQGRNSNSYGYFVKQERDDKSGMIAHSTEEAAIEYAKELAAKNPKVMYGVFSCLKVFETSEPQIITKKFNDGGELVLDIQSEQGNV